MNYEGLRNSISSTIKTNGEQRITGAVLQEVLLNMVSSLGQFASYAGIANPGTNPAGIDGNVFYIATTAGYYQHFGFTISTSGYYIISNLSGVWNRVRLPIAADSATYAGGISVSGYNSVEIRARKIAGDSDDIELYSSDEDFLVYVYGAEIAQRALSASDAYNLGGIAASLYLTKSVAAATYQPLITATNKLPYSFLSGTPTIPTNNNQLANGAGYITQAALTGYALKSELPTLRGLMGNSPVGGDTSYAYWDGASWKSQSLGSLAFSDATIPTNNNQLENGAGYINAAYVSQYLADNNYAKKSDITAQAVGLGNVQNTAFYTRSVDVNGEDWEFASRFTDQGFSIYAPTSAGTTGQVLVSTGGTPTWASSVAKATSATYAGGISVSGYNSVELRARKIAGDSDDIEIYSSDKDFLVYVYGAEIAQRALSASDAYKLGGIAASLYLTKSDAAATYQPLSTAINTGNIASQSVAQAQKLKVDTTSDTEVFPVTDYEKISAVSVYGDETPIGERTVVLNIGDVNPFGAQIAVVTDGIHDIGYRKKGDTAWKLVAFTDSNVASATRARYIETKKANFEDWYGNQYRVFARWDNYNILEWATEGNYPVRVDIAKKLNTPRTIWGQSFDGSGNVSGDMSGVETINSHYKFQAGDSIAATLFAESHLASGGVDYIDIHVSDKTDSQTHRPLVLQHGFGNVGIGTTDPQYKLEVVGDLCVNRNNHEANNTTFRINCIDAQVNLYAEDLDDAICSLGFYIEGKEAMRINNSGHVGIGITSPVYKLDVAGTGRFTGNLTVSTINNGTPITSSNIRSYLPNLLPIATYRVTNYNSSLQKLYIETIDYQKEDYLASLPAGAIILITNPTGIYLQQISRVEDSSTDVINVAGGGVYPGSDSPSTILIGVVDYDSNDELDLHLGYTNY